MKVKILGTGAAGNKASINLIEKGILDRNKILLINSTLKDIPDGYHDIAIKLADSTGGCGKERDLSKTLTLNSIRKGSLGVLDSLIEPDDEVLIIVSSSEGGTGSGSTAILAKYFKQVIGIAVHCFVFTGFEEDGRGLQNTIEYFQELSEEYTVHAISNKKFLDGITNNKLKAEKAANDEFARRIRILTQEGIVDSEQNIDETDMYKVSTTPGFMTIGLASIDKIKNVEQFNKIITETIDNDKSLDVTEESIKRLAVFINASEKIRDYIDYSFSVIKNKLGIPYEVFTHVQYNDELPEFVSFIASGMKMPIDEVKEVYDKYKKESERVNKSKDSFFDFASDLKGNSDDAMFNVNRHTLRNPAEARKSFFDDFNMETSKDATVNVAPSPVQNKNVNNNNSNSNGATITKKSKQEFLNEKF